MGSLYSASHPIVHTICSRWTRIETVNKIQDSQKPENWDNISMKSSDLTSGSSLISEYNISTIRWPFTDNTECDCEHKLKYASGDQVGILKQTLREHQEAFKAA